MGLANHKFYEKYSLNFMQSFSYQMSVKIIESIEMGISYNLLFDLLLLHLC